MPLRVSLVQLFKTGLFEKVGFSKSAVWKVEDLIKTVKKYFLERLNVWLALIKVTVWVVNYQNDNVHIKYCENTF